MSSFDGRKRSVIYLGVFSPMKLLDWYLEIKKSLKKEGFAITHLSLGTKTKVTKRITQLRRTEKRYIELFNKNPSDCVSLELYCVENDVKNISSNYLVSMALIKSRYSEKSFAMLVFDFSILDQVNIDTYMNITKKYMNWNKEVVFDCGKTDSPISYTINLSSWGYKEFKLISERDNDKQ